MYNVHTLRVVSLDEFETADKMKYIFDIILGFSSFIHTLHHYLTHLTLTRGLAGAVFQGLNSQKDYLIKRISVAPSFLLPDSARIVSSGHSSHVPSVSGDNRMKRHR